MPEFSETHAETLIQHLGEESHILGAVVPPIFQNSLFIFDDWDEFRASFSYDGETRFNYSRITNPTLDLVERKIAALEKMERAKLFSSGMAAISAAIMSCVSQGDHVVCVDTVYGPTRTFLLDYLPKFGITTTMVDGRDPQEWIDATRPETKLFYLESPGSILFRLQDFRPICDFARSKGISTITDNSYATPLFQQPSTMGVDIVVHSASKYFGGHSDVIAGIVATSSERMLKMINGEVALFGGALAPFPAWLILRSLRTMPIRLRAHQETANTVATWVRNRPEILRVHHVGFDDFPQADLRDKQMSGSSGLFSFEPKFTEEIQVRKFCESLRVFRMGVSWGGHESLVVPTWQQPMDWDEAKWVVRLYCGLEHPDDLIADIRQALEAVASLPSVS